MIDADLRARIRRLYFVEHWKRGTIATQLGVHFDTVVLALDLKHPPSLRKGHARCLLRLRGPRRFQPDCRCQAAGNGRAGPACGWTRLRVIRKPFAGPGHVSAVPPAIPNSPPFSSTRDLIRPSRDVLLDPGFAAARSSKTVEVDKYGNAPYISTGSVGETIMTLSSANSRRTERLEARVPAELKDVFVRAAALRGQSLTDFIVSTVAEAAQQVVREQDILELTRRDQVAFANALLHPPAPSAKLRSAARSFRRRAGK